MRVRRTGIATALAAVVAATTLVPAVADETQDRKRSVDASIQALQGELAETSQELAAAAHKLQQTEQRLAEARAAVAEAEAQVAAAQQRDAELAEELAEARAEEARSRRQLARVEAELERTKRALGAVARRAYLGGAGTGLGQVGVALEAQSVRDYTDHKVMARSVLGSESVVADRLEDDRIRVAAATARLEAQRQVVDGLKKEAEANLERRTSLRERAVDAQRDVEQLVAAAAAAKAAIEREKAAEAARLAALQAQSSQLEAQLVARAEAARARLAAQGGGDQSRASRSVRGNGALVLPVAGRLTSPYGMRTHPITGVHKLHDGIDYGAPCGTPIKAAAAGEVVWAENKGGYGYQLAIDHGIVNGVHLATSYSHVSAGGFTVRPGEQVRAGQQVAKVGSTGYSTGCHLHFMVYVEGAPTNPSSWL